MADKFTENFLNALKEIADKKPQNILVVGTIFLEHIGWNVKSMKLIGTEKVKREDHDICSTFS